MRNTENYTVLQCIYMTFEEYHNGSIPEWTLILSVIKADNA